MKSKFFKRKKMLPVLGIVTVLSFPLQSVESQNSEGFFKPTEESFRQYRCPEWFRDAKLGFWAHWGPQAVPRQGDWYARRMYIEGDPAYKYHVAHYGHPSEFGYKDIIPLWKAERWDPGKLMALFKKAGAKYFVTMGSHHDNFFLWNSALHPWNSVNYGPHKDVVGLWKEAAKKEGLRFGVSEHLGASFTWFQTSHGADKSGPKAGIPYDGNDPMHQDLYHAPAESDDSGWLSKNKEWQREWMFYIKELLDNYQPDLLYSDSSFPFEEYGRNLIAYFYNQNMKQNDGKLEAVYTCKQASQGMWVEDIERGLKDSISEIPWQIDTSIGDWYYRTGQEYKTSGEVIKMLVDVVSKNGNLLINIVQTPEGDIERDVLEIVEEIGQWMSVNGEGIYGTRPWKIFGEHPAGGAVVKSGSFNEDKMKYTAEDIRFTTKEDALYAFCLGKPSEKIKIVSLGKKSSVNGKTIKSVKMLGSNEIMKWEQAADALVIDSPSGLPVEKVPVPGFRIEFK